VIGNQSRRGALSRSMSQIALSISSSVISLTNWLFSWLETMLGILASIPRTSSFVLSLLGCWYKKSKWWNASYLNFSKVSSYWPVFERMEVTVIFFLRISACLWKEVFESPAFSQRFLNFNLQFFSSLHREWCSCYGLFFIDLEVSRWLPLLLTEVELS